MVGGDGGEGGCVCGFGFGDLGGYDGGLDYGGKSLDERLFVDSCWDVESRSECLSAFLEFAQIV